MDIYWSFTEPFTENAQTLYELLFTKDFNADNLKAQLDTGVFSSEDVNMAAFLYVENCHFADMEAHSRHLFDGIPFGELVPGIESSHLAEAIRILLEYGFDSDKVFMYDDGGCMSIMSQLMFVFNGYQSADAAAEIFSHGGDPSMMVEEVSLIRELNAELLFYLGGDEEFRYFSDSVVHYWMVFIGYGARLEKGEECIDPVADFDTSQLRNHRQYYYGMIHSERSNDGMEVCFFDKDTNWEVARY